MKAGQTDSKYMLPPVCFRPSKCTSGCLRTIISNTSLRNFYTAQSPLHHPDPKLLKSWACEEMDGDSGGGSTWTIRLIKCFHWRGGGGSRAQHTTVKIFLEGCVGRVCMCKKCGRMCVWDPMWWGTVGLSRRWMRWADPSTPSHHQPPTTGFTGWALCQGSKHAFTNTDNQQ